jgi:hypothetical protein
MSIPIRDTRVRAHSDANPTDLVGVPDPAAAADAPQPLQPDPDCGGRSGFVSFIPKQSLEERTCHCGFGPDWVPPTSTQIEKLSPSIPGAHCEGDTASLGTHQRG